MTGQEKMTFKYGGLLNKGDRIHRLTEYTLHSARLR